MQLGFPDAVEYHSNDDRIGIDDSRFELVDHSGVHDDDSKHRQLQFLFGGHPG